MKKLYFVLLITVVLAFSCTKEEFLKPDQGFDQAVSKSCLISTGSVIQVIPNGNDDTQTLIDAFNQAANLGEKGVVKLMPGTFKIGMIEIKEFRGTIAGCGKEKTVITNLPGLTPDELIQLNKLPALITFIGGDVTVSDLSIKLTEGLPWLGQQEMNLLMFSDYSADFVPSKKHIEVNLDDIEITGLLRENVELWDGGPITDIPYDMLNGVKFAPDIKLNENIIVPRCNIDLTISKSEFSNLSQGVYIWGCKSGKFNIGTIGGNMFSNNIQGLVVNENLGVNVKILNNEFTIPDYYWDGIDLNSGEAIFGYLPLEDVQADPGNYEVKYNTFNIHNSQGFGLWDSWRYMHPENPLWMKMIWDHNTFNLLAYGAGIGWAYNLKNALFSNNKITGNSDEVYIIFTGIYWTDPNDPNYLLTWSENCKFLNNIILQKDLYFILDSDTKDFLVVGDLSNMLINDYGIDNKFIDKKNPRHSNDKFSNDFRDRTERIRNFYDWEREHHRH